MHTPLMIEMSLYLINFIPSSLILLYGNDVYRQPVYFDVMGDQLSSERKIDIWYSELYKELLLNVDLKIMPYLE